MPKNVMGQCSIIFRKKNNRIVSKQAQNFLKLVQSNPEAQTRKKMQEMTRFLPWKMKKM